jgi:hypothetical protein
LFTDRLFHDDMAVGSSIMLAIAVSGPLALVLLWYSRAPYRKTMANLDFG